MTVRLAPAAALLLAALAGCATSYEDGYNGGYGYYGGYYGYGRPTPHGYYWPYYDWYDDDDYLWPYLYYFPHGHDRHRHHDRRHDRWRDRQQSHDGAPPPAAEPQPPLQAGPGVIEPAPPAGGRHQGRAGPRPERPFEAGPLSPPPGRGQLQELRAPHSADRQPRPGPSGSAALQEGEFPLVPATPRRQQSQR
jgi:hypothetical protein